MQLDLDHGLTDLGSECGYQPVKKFVWSTINFTVQL